MIDYEAKISKHFTFHEALWLPHWNRHGEESDGLTPQVLKNLKTFFGIVDNVRDFFGAPFNVHCAWRPVKYNQLPAIKGAANSAHLANAACAALDFDVTGIACDQAREAILKHDLLSQLNLRMEDNGKSAPWLHLDNRAVLPGHSHFFKP